MSEENVEILRAFHEALSKGDYDDAVRCMHPVVEIYPAVGGELEFQRLYRGREGFKQWWGEAHQGFRVTVEVEELREARDGRVLQVERWCFHGRQAIETEIKVSDLYAFRDGLISRVNGFRDRAEALEAAGLSE